MKTNCKECFHTLPRWTQQILLRIVNATRRLGPFYKCYFEIGCPRYVLGGLFRGIDYRFPDSCRSSFSNFLPKLLGSYELEIQRTLEKWQALRWDLIIDVGSAEGYYVIGFCQKWRVTRIVAYDNDNQALELLRKNIKHIKRSNIIEVRSLCTHAELETLGDKINQMLVFIDIEGGEWELLDPKLAPVLQRAYILVEVHEQFRQGVGEELKCRFSQTHAIEEIFAKPRVLKDFPKDVNVSDKTKMFTMDERRGAAMSWLAMTPRPALAVRD